MSRRKLLHVCDECGQSYDGKERADECERWHREQREYEARDELRNEIADATIGIDADGLRKVLEFTNTLRTQPTSGRKR